MDGREIGTLVVDSGVEGSARFGSLAFSPDRQILASPVPEGIVLWNFDLEDLITKSCAWLRDYMTNPATPPEKKALCAEELGLPLNSTVPSRVNWVANVRGFWRDLFGEE